MIPNDLMIIQGEGGKKIRAFEAPSGVTYQLVLRPQMGAIGNIFTVIALNGPRKGESFALKEYSPAGNDVSRRRILDRTRRFLQRLIDRPLPESIRPIITAPLELVDFPITGSFGCIMERVDLTDFVTLGQLRTRMPDAGVLTKLCMGVAHFYDQLSREGLCIPGLGEGDFWLHPVTGEVRFPVLDNISPVAGLPCIGSPQYMAPELHMGRCEPDSHTSRFQLAVFLFRLLLGAYPYEGPRAVRFMSENDMSLFESSASVLGDHAVFIFDPHDKSNAAAASRLPSDASPTEKAYHKSWQRQTELWNRLPAVLRANFIHAFTCTQYEEREGRVTARQWEQVFRNLQQSQFICPACQRETFGDRRCFFCGHTLPG